MGVFDGAAKGAAVGSVVPGVGTVAGGVIGGIAGLFGGDDDPNADVIAPVKQGQVTGQGYWGGIDATYKDGVRQAGTSGAEMDAARYRGMGDAAMGRGGPQVDYGRANRSLGYAAAMRGQQQQAARLAQQAALGNAPSKAEILGRNMIDQSLQSQLAGAASARGGSLGQAAAMRQAQLGAAGFQQQGMNQLAGMRADEMANARAQWAGQLSGIRGQDFNAAQTAAQMAQQQAQFEMQQRQLNDARAANMERLGFDTMKTGAELEQSGTRIGIENQKMRNDVAADERQQDMALAAAGINAAATLGGAAIKGPSKADGGPVEGGEPYMVGERGPELIVPAKDGVVVPNHQLSDVIPLYEPPGKQLHQGADGRAFFRGEPSEDDGRPRLASGPITEKRASLAKAAAMRAKAPAASRPLTPDELRAAADKLEREMKGTHQARMAAGPAVSPTLGQAAADRAASDIAGLRAAYAAGEISDSEYNAMLQLGPFATPPPPPEPPPMRTRNPNEGPYEDPDGPTIYDEDWNSYDEDNLEATRLAPPRLMRRA